MSGWAGCRRWLYDEAQRVAGVAAMDGLVLLAGLERCEEHWRVAALESVLFVPEEGAWAQSVAEKTAALLARIGYEDAPVVLAAPPDAAYVEEMQLPALSPDEIAQTAHWEMAAREPFGGAPFLTAYEDAGEGVCRVAAVPQSEAEGYRSAFAAAGVRLWAAAAVPAAFRLLCEGAELRWGAHALPLSPALLAEDGAFHDWDERLSAAIYGAALLVHAVPEQGCAFPLGAVRLSSLHVRRIACMAASLVAALLLLATGIDAYQLYSARQEAEQIQAELALSRGERNRMEDFRSEEAWIARRDDCLQELSEDNPPAAAVLSLLGASNVEGVRLKALRLEPEKGLELDGEALTYDALADYLGGLERQEHTLFGGAALKGSSRQQDGSIAFSLSVPLQEETAQEAGEDRGGKEEGASLHASME